MAMVVHIVNFQQGDIGLIVGTNQLHFFIFLAIPHHHGNFVCIFNHMIVGQYITIGADHKTGGLAFLVTRLLPLLSAGHGATKEPFEKILIKR
jgi:hypothetical protein